VVLSIEAKSVGPSRWEVFTDNGRERTGRDVVAWVKEAVGLGAGEVLLTSVDREGTRKGFDVALVRAVSGEVGVPIIASGGMGKAQDLVEVVEGGGADAVAMADILHYNRATIGELRGVAAAAGFDVRAA
jgi:cyclase